jgi:flavin reductase (DIM6/NTAB) family NADH-FMN oxidoreductase RutF
MSVTKEQFKATLSQWASGITVVTTLHPTANLHAITVSAFSSISLEPPLIMVAIAQKAEAHDLIAQAKVFGVMILNSQQPEISQQAAGFTGKEGHQLPGSGYGPKITGAPILADCLAWLDCTVYAAYPVGDHTIYVGQVMATGTQPGQPLLWYDRDYRQVQF